MTKIKTIKSSYAIVDVTTGAQALEKHFKGRPVSGPCPEEFRIPVTLSGYIQYAHGNHDGISQEFSMIVEKIEITS